MSRSGRIGLFIRSERSESRAPQLEMLAELVHAIAAYFGNGGTTGPGPTRKGHVPTVLTEDGRIRTPEGDVPQRLSQAIQGNFPYDVWTDAARVSFYESSWKADATNDTRWRASGRCGERYWYSDEVGWAQTEYSVGYFQINICAHGHDAEYWYDADNNARKGGELYAASGWNDWKVTGRKLGLLE